jgi:hypothetical protein
MGTITLGLVKRGHEFWWHLGPKTKKKNLLGRVFNEMAKDNMLKVVTWIRVGIISCDNKFMQE